MKTLKKKDRREYIKELIKDNYKCENLCGNNNLCVKILPYFKCGHFQCIDTTIKINFCITCGERKRIIKDNEVYNEPLYRGYESYHTIYLCIPTVYR